MGDINLSVPQSHFMLANSLFGLGMGLFMVPLTTYALATIQKNAVTEASGLFSYGRMLGTSIGIALLSTLVVRVSQVNWNQMGAHIHQGSQNLQQWLTQQHLSLHSPQALFELQQTLKSQANLLAFIDAYRLIAVCLLLLIPLVLCLKNVVLTKEG